MSDVVPHDSNPPIVESNQRDQPHPAGRRRLLRGLGLLLLVLALLGLFYGMVAFLGWESGQRIRAERIQNELAEQLQRQVVLAEQDVADDNNALALRRLDWVLAREPGNETAQRLRDQAEAALAAKLTPAATATALPTSTPLPLSGQAQPTPDIEAGLDAIEALIEEMEYEEAVEALIAFQTAYPDYERRRTDVLLYSTYITLGVELIYGESIERGLYYLGQAETLGDLPVDVADQRGWAELYLTGISFYGVDWSASTYYLRQLCAAAPFFQDSCTVLYDALVTWADQYADNLDWCPAESLYRDARQYTIGSELNRKIADATENCLAATPTPTATVTGPITGTLPLTQTLTVTPVP